MSCGGGGSNSSMTHSYPHYEREQVDKTARILGSPRLLRRALVHWRVTRRRRPNLDVGLIQPQVSARALRAASQQAARRHVDAMLRRTERFMEAAGLTGEVAGLGVRWL